MKRILFIVILMLFITGCTSVNKYKTLSGNTLQTAADLAVSGNYSIIQEEPDVYTKETLIDYWQKSYHTTDTKIVYTEKSNTLAGKSDYDKVSEKLQYNYAMTPMYYTIIVFADRYIKNNGYEIHGVSSVSVSDAYNVSEVSIITEDKKSLHFVSVVLEDDKDGQFTLLVLED